MSREFDSSDFVDLPRSPDALDVPIKYDVLADGREVVVLGDVDRWGDGFNRQGDNELGFLGTCGLCSCADVLRQFDVEVSENDIVEFAVESDLCSVCDDPTLSGGTTILNQVEILVDHGVPAHFGAADSLETLAESVETDRGVIVEMNAGILWADLNHYGNGGPNHAVTIVGVARELTSGTIAGFYINDTGTGDSGRFVDTITMQAAWLDAGGLFVETDVSRPTATNR